MMILRRSAPFAGFVAAVVSLAACTSGSGTQHASSTMPSSSTSASAAPTSASAPDSPSPSVPTTGPNVRPGEKPPTLPAVGKTNTRAGADAFARYWISSLDWGYATTSSVLARELFTPTCVGCARFLTNIIDSTRTQGQHFNGGRISIKSTLLHSTDHHDSATAIVDLLVDQAPLVVIGASGKKISTSPPLSDAIFRVWLRWSSGRRAVVDWKTGVQK